MKSFTCLVTCIIPCCTRGRHPGPVKLCVCFYETEYKYSLFTKCRRIFRLLWATTLSYWERTTMAHFSDRILICIFFYEFIVFWLKFLRNLLTLVQLTTSQCWLKLCQTAPCHYPKKWQPSSLTQNLRHMAWMNKWSHSAWIRAVFCFGSAVVTVQSVHTFGRNWPDLTHALWADFIKSLTGIRKSDNCRHSGGWNDCSNGHYNDVIMASQITSLTIAYSTFFSGADQRKHQISASLAFVRRTQRWPANSPHKGSVTWKMFPFDDVIMVSRTFHFLWINRSALSLDKRKFCSLMFMKEMNH